jgi:guanylate kinase
LSSGSAATIARRGLMLVLSSPSGAGKTTISRALLDTDDTLTMSISVTTRPPRPGERDGVDYHFLTQERYAAMVADGALLEHARVFGHQYGTPRADVERSLAAGRDVLFDIDWQGTQQLREAAADDLVTVFVLPPSTPELERRLRVRAQDSEQTVRTRMAKAADEMSHWAEYDYIIVNRELAESVRQTQAVLAAERLRRHRLIGLDRFVHRLREAPDDAPD